MREIGIKALRKVIGHELDDLPFEIIKRGRRIAVVVESDWYDGIEVIAKEYENKNKL